MGALGPEEEREVEAHLEECPSCREEVADLRLAHERLTDLVNMEETPPPELKDRLLTGMPRRETRRVPLAAAAAILCALAVLGVLYYTGFFAPDEVASANLQATDLAPKAGGELRVREDPNARAELEVWGLPQPGKDEYYELWFGRRGAHERWYLHGRRPGPGDPHYDRARESQQLRSGGHHYRAVPQRTAHERRETGAHRRARGILSTPESSSPTTRSRRRTTRRSRHVQGLAFQHVNVLLVPKGEAILRRSRGSFKEINIERDPEAARDIVRQDRTDWRAGYQDREQVDRRVRQGADRGGAGLGLLAHRSAYSPLISVSLPYTRLYEAHHRREAFGRA